MNQKNFVKTLVIFFLFAAFNCAPTPASATNLDSLNQVAGNTNASNESRIGAYIELVSHYESEDPDLAIEIGKKGLSLHVDTAYNLVGLLNANVGFAYYIKQELAEGLPYFERAAEAFVKAGNKGKAGQQFKNIGIFYRKLGNAQKAIEYQLMGLKLFEEIKDIERQVSATMNIGNVYIFQKQPELALPYFKKALDLSKQISDSLVQAEAFNSYALGFDNLEQNDSAMYYYTIAIEHYSDLGKLLAKAKAEHNLALVYFEEEQYFKAEEMLLASQSVFERVPDRFAIEKAKIEISLGRIYHRTNRSEQAIPHIQNAIAVFRDKGVLSALKTSLLYLSEAYEGAGQYHKAFLTQREFMVIRDSIQNAEITTSIAEMNEKYESEKKENQILTLKNENISKEKQTLFTLVVSGGILAILIIVFLIYRQIKTKQLTEIRLKLKQNVRELDLMREKIEQGTTQHLTPNLFTIDRADVNAMLKEDLSERELDVFMLLIEGLTNKEISEKLFISVSTIKFHLQNIYLKLDVNNRKAAVQALTTRTGHAA